MRAIILISFLLIISSNVNSQTTYIPDNGFEEILIIKGLDTIADNSIATSIIDTITNITIPFNYIQDLTGIEDFIALKSLVCRNNYIDSLDLSSLTHLEFLNCENNQLVYLNVTNNANLKNLRCEDNNLTDLDLNQNVLLTELEIGRNPLVSIDLSQNINLTEFLAFNTFLPTYDLSNNTLLETLDLTNNYLTQLDISNLTELKTVILFGNYLTELDLTNNINLELFFGMGNQFESLDFSNNQSMTHILCHGNNLTQLNLPIIDPNQIDTITLSTTYNPQLNCIQSNNPNHIYTHWDLHLDSTTTISENCYLGLEPNSNETQLFPNPTNGPFYVNSSNKGTYSIMNLGGQLIKKGQIEIGSNILDLSYKTNGLYIIQIQLENETLIYKLEKH